jgi:hypothetical protein
LLASGAVAANAEAIGGLVSTIGTTLVSTLTSSVTSLMDLNN